MYYLLINYKTISSPCPGGSDNAHFRVRERLMRQINWKKERKKAIYIDTVIGQDIFPKFPQAERTV